MKTNDVSIIMSFLKLTSLVQDLPIASNGSLSDNLEILFYPIDERGKIISISMQDNNISC